MWLDQNRLKFFLVDSGLISAKEIDSLASEAASNGKSLEEIILNHGRLSEDDLRRAKAYVLGIPFADLRRIQIPKEVLSLIPEPVARRHNIVAIERTGDHLAVAMLDPEDIASVDFIKKSVGVKILPRLTDVESMKKALLQYQKSLKDEFSEIITSEAGKLDAVQAEAISPDKLAEGLPVVRLVDALLAHAITQQASDIHIEPFEAELVIRYRIDGLLHDAMVLPRTAAPGIVARIKVLSNLRLDEKRLPQDGRFKIEREDQKISFRVSILPTFFGEKVVMRLLPENSRGLSLAEGGFHGEALERIHRAIRHSTGMILVTGPTGSGKTTTLYTLMEILNTPDVNISTIEDPIEYQMPRINQTQVKPEIGLSFGSGLRSLVRQDPDIIMVGEIRDNETVGLAINAALTGHLVLSTLHTNSAAGTVPRMLDMGAEPFLIVSTVKVIVAQRLVRRLAENKEQYFLSESEFKQLSQTVDLDRVLEQLKAEKVVGDQASWKDIPFYKPKPTEGSDGFASRIGIHEVLEMSSAIKELVLRGGTMDEIEAQAKKEGMVTMLEDGIYQSVCGVTTIEEVLRAINE